MITAGPAVIRFAYWAEFDGTARRGAGVMAVLGAPGTAAAARVLVSLHTAGAAAQGLVAGFYSRRATPITASLEHVLSQAVGCQNSAVTC
jgi:hypothetical protein